MPLPAHPPQTPRKPAHCKCHSGVRPPPLFQPRHSAARTVSHVGMASIARRTSPSPLDLHCEYLGLLPPPPPCFPCSSPPLRALFIYPLPFPSPVASFDPAQLRCLHSFALVFERLASSLLVRPCRRHIPYILIACVCTAVKAPVPFIRHPPSLGTPSCVPKDNRQAFDASSPPVGSILSPQASSLSAPRRLQQRKPSRTTEPVAQRRRTSPSLP